MNPIPGQPGLYRAPPNGRQQIVDFYSARRTAMADFSVPPPAGPYTWNYPRRDRGRPWTIGGLGDLASLRAQYLANETRYDEIKRAATPILAAHPFSASSYADMAQRVVSLPRGTIVRLSLDQFAVLTRGVLSVVSQAQAMAAALLDTPSRQGQARKILFAVKDALDTYDRLLNGIYTASRAPEIARRAVGLGEPVTLTTGGIIAIVIGVTFIITVGAVLLYALFSSLQAASAASAEAQEACERDAAAGRPCSGAQWQEYLRRAQEGQRTFGNVPDLRELFSSLSSLLFWGGLLALGAGLGYLALTAEPARRNVQERLRRASEANRYNGPR